MLAAQTRKKPVFNIKGALRLFIKSGEEEPSPILMAAQACYVSHVARKFLRG